MRRLVDGKIQDHDVFVKDATRTQSSESMQTNDRDEEGTRASSRALHDAIDQGPKGSRPTLIRSAHSLGRPRSRLDPSEGAYRFGGLTRGISKPWPPGDVAPDGHALRAFTTPRKRTQALPAAANQVALRAEFDRLDKRKLRVEMYREQRFICIASGGSPRNPTPRIDHWQPSASIRLALHWRNSAFVLCLARDPRFRQR